MGLLATALACLAITPGCGGPPVEAPPTVAQFKLSYERSGGLVANPRSLEIAPGRHATAKRRKLPSRSDSLITANFRIGVEQVKRLRNALEFLRSQLSLTFTTEDIVEGVTAFFEKRDPQWKGR